MNKLKTFTSMLVTEKVAVKDKEIVVRADRDLFARLLMIREKQDERFLEVFIGSSCHCTKNEVFH